MGCDIHPAVQYRSKGDNAYWHNAFDEGNWGRNYALFSRMAGVRGGFEGAPEPISQPRGFPPGSWAGMDDDDLHTPSWLTFAEVQQLAREFEDVDLHATLAMMTLYESRGFEARLIFAFDN